MANDPLNTEQVACARPRLMWVNRYIGIPFVDHGASMDGCFCWGLVHLVLKNEAGIETPTYTEISAFDDLFVDRAISEAKVSGVWHPVERTDIRQFDVMLSKAITPSGKRYQGHVGVMVDARTVLHTWDDAHSCLMQLDHHFIRHKIIGFFRHRELLA